MALTREIIQEIKHRADIVQIVGERVALSPAGSNFKGLCPFHGEKTPSFIVNPERHMYHCFGCGAGGSVIDFVMAADGLEFGDAAELLAERLGIALPRGRGEASGRQREAAALDAAARAVDHDAWVAAADRFLADLTTAERTTVARLLGVLNDAQMSSAEREAIRN